MIKIILSQFCLYSVVLDATTILHTQDRVTLRREMVQSLEDAKSSILIFTFTFSDPELLLLLNKKADEGVDVTVVIDKEHNLPLKSAAHPAIKLLSRSTGEGRVHHKILVIDENEVWIGSLNFTESAFHIQENSMVQLESHELAAYLQSEKEVYAGTCVRNATTETRFDVDGEVIFFGLLPHDGFPPKKEEALINEQAKKALLSTIHAAKERIQIAMMVWTDFDLANAVTAAHRRGVQVDVVAADFGGVIPELSAAGIRVRVNPKFSLMHNKFVYIDNKVFVNGSANWSKSSFTRNDESFVILYKISPEDQIKLNDYWEYLSN